MLMRVEFADIVMNSIPLKLQDVQFHYKTNRHNCYSTQVQMSPICMAHNTLQHYKFMLQATWFRPRACTQLQLHYYYALCIHTKRTLFSWSSGFLLKRAASFAFNPPLCPGDDSRPFDGFSVGITIDRN